MRRILISTLAVSFATIAGAQNTAAPADSADPIRDMVGRLELEKYKATIKGLTQFGDRRQGTQRNRDAVDWIEAQLKSYGCATERIADARPLTPSRRSSGDHGNSSSTLRGTVSQYDVVCICCSGRSRSPEPTFSFV